MTPSFFDAAHVTEVIDRLGRLEPTSPRRWGTMTAHEMVCHLSDSFLAVLGDRRRRRRKRGSRGRS